MNPMSKEWGEYFVEQEEAMAAPKGNCYNPAGRPQKHIDWKLFEDMCEIQCTQSEIANCLKIHPNTLSDRAKEHYKEDYSIVYKKFSECGKMSLRRLQFKLAQKNVSMAIFLGKQWLGQSDAPAEQVVTDILVKKFDDIMSQVRDAQSTRKMSSNSESITA